jgi:hypothetical protein
VPLSPPPLHSFTVGVSVASTGVILMAFAMWGLWRRGGGLPMNAFPPPRHVSSGVYAILPHPIYVGFVAMCAGVAIAAGSGVGLWITTPLVALGCMALVVGYEGPSLTNRFGAQRTRPWLAVLSPTGGTPTRAERWGTLAIVMIPWLLAYEGVKALGVPRDAIDLLLPGEAHWPVFPWTELIYASTYIAVPLAFLLAPSRRALRGFALKGIVATVILTIVYLCLPIEAPMRPPAGNDLLSRLLLFEQAQASPPVAAFPSFHVLWAGLVAHALSTRSRGWLVGWWLWAAAVAVSCSTTGMHSLVDVVSGVLCWIPFCQMEKLWGSLIDGAERLANSWRAFHFGGLRFINHGVYAGAAGLIGSGVAIWLSGDAAGVGVVGAVALVSASLWAQFVEGSTSLQRPFGYFGFLLGGVLAIASLHIFRGGAMTTAAAICIGGSFALSVGRLRCLVQGCCHGAPTEHARGIIVTDLHSRVCALSHLSGVSIHPTQLYSIAANLASAALLLRLWVVEAPVSVIAGMYLVFAGLARFVEEGFRGEVQTMKHAGLALYQWMSIASAFGGLLLAAMPSVSADPPPETGGRGYPVPVARHMLRVLVCDGRRLPSLAAAVCAAVGVRRRVSPPPAHHRKSRDGCRAS